MRFENPNILLLLFALPALAGFFWWALRRKRRLLERFAAAEALERLIATVSRRKQIARAVALTLAVGLILFALARPQWGVKSQSIERKGVDLMVAIDTSRSMLAQDIPPSRLQRAKDQLTAIIHRARGDRVGVIAFAGEAIVQCPLTLDYGLAMDFLSAITPETVPTQGTAIGDAIRAAIKAFERSGTGQQALVLLTDGEDQGTDPLAAAEEAADKGIIIYAIGIGTREGNPIPAGGNYLKDDAGAPVNTRLDAETLQKIALKTGGKYIEGKPSGELEMEEIYASIDRLQKVSREAVKRSVYEERFHWFLLAAALILAAEMIMTDRKRRVEA